MQLYLLPRFFAGHLQPLVRFWPAFARTRFNSTGSVADPSLGDRAEQDLVVRGRHAGEPLGNPFGPDLHRVFEAQQTRMHTSLVCRLGHQQPYQIVGEDIHP